MVGGAVREPRRIDVYGSQHDIAATLLAQLALPHDEFVFSKDMLNPASLISRSLPYPMLSVW